MRFGRSIPPLVLSLLVAPGAVVGAAQDAPVAERPVINVAVLFDGPTDASDERRALTQQSLVFDGIREQTRKLTERQFDVRFPEDKRRGAKWDIEQARAAIDRLMQDPEVDMVLSLGPLSTHEIVRREDFPKPVIAAWAIDVQAQQLPLGQNATGVRNLNYLTTRGSTLNDLAKFALITPLSTVHVLLDSDFVRAIPEIPQYVTAAAREAEIELVVVSSGADPEAVLAALPDQTRAVYVAPLLQMSERGFDRLVDGLNSRGIASFSLLGEEEVERGILGGVRPRTDRSLLARRIALNIQRILLGENAGTLPVFLERPERLMINMATARQIGVYPRWRVLLEAVQIDPEVQESAPLLTFDGAVGEAVQANLTLRATDRSVAAGLQRIARARSALRPQIESFVSGVQIDDDRAAASFGSRAERTLTGGLSLTQLVYSDAVRANLDTAKSQQQALEWERESVRLDIALESATAYLDVLRAETLERVERDNLRLTESNLDIAIRQQEIGSAGPADVYRFQAKLANDRAAVIAVQNRNRQARIALNRLLNRALEAPFRTEAPDLEEPWLITCCKRLEPYIDNPGTYALFRDFLVREGLVNSVELDALDASIAAQDRVVLAAHRSYGSPEIGLRADAERDFSKDGAGTAGTGASLPIAGPDRDNWSLSLRASLPLFQGGARTADLRQALEELSALRLQRDLLTENLEARIRIGALETGSSYPTIELAEEAARAAGKNLELLTDAYSRGVVSIIDLLDAQNAAFEADAAAANAVFDFLIDLMEVQRASNSLDFFTSDAGRDAWFERLHTFFAEMGHDFRPAER